MDDATADVNGAHWKVSKLTDWTSPDQQQQLGDVTGRPGATMLHDGHGAHIFGIEGIAYGPTLEVVDAAAAMLNRMPGVAASGLVVVHESVPKQITVRQGGVPKASDPDRRNAGWKIDFQLTFAALDPYKRGLDSHTQHLAAGGSASVTNAGNVPAILTLTATGAGTVVVRQDGSGQVLRTRSSVDSGTKFDGANRRVTTSGGVDIFPMGAPSEWLSVPAESTVSLSNLGTAAVDVSWFDPYA
jgi:hypothetical protein